jgi:hypothetical protein
MGGNNKIKSRPHGASSNLYLYTEKETKTVNFVLFKHSKIYNNY